MAHQNALVAGQCIACGEGLTDAGFGHINRRRHLRRAPIPERGYRCSPAENQDGD